MRVAIVSGTPAFPPIEGNRARILNLARAIREEGHEIWFVYLPTWSLSDVDGAAHEIEFGEGRFVTASGEVTTGRVPLPFKLQRKAYKLAGHSHRYYNHLDEYYGESWTSQLRALDERVKFDAVFVEYIFHSKAFSAFRPGLLKVLDTHDKFADRHMSFIGSRNPYGYWFSVPPAIEEKALRRADAVLAIQDFEAEDFERRLGRKPPAVFTVSHLLDTSERVDDFRPVDALFLGSGNDANIASLTYFIETILPLVVASQPAFRLLLAGSICSRIPDHPRIEKLGRVDKPIDAFRRAPVLINPMLIGTGIAIKLLDSMAAGVATVSTKTGARGLQKEFLDFLSVVDDSDPSAFASEILRLVQSEDARRAAGAAAYEGALRWNERQRSSLRDALSTPPAR